MKKEDIPSINNLAKDLEKAGKKLEDSYYNGDPEEFANSKKEILILQKKILEMIR